MKPASFSSRLVLSDWRCSRQPSLPRQGPHASLLKSQPRRRPTLLQLSLVSVGLHRSRRGHPRTLPWLGRRHAQNCSRKQCPAPSLQFGQAPAGGLQSLAGQVHLDVPCSQHFLGLLRLSRDATARSAFPLPQRCTCLTGPSCRHGPHPSVQPEPQLDRSRWQAQRTVVQVSCIDTNFESSLVAERCDCRNPIDCLLKTFRAEGIRGLYKGTTAHLLRIAPHTVVTLVANEFVSFSPDKRISPGKDEC